MNHEANTDACRRDLERLQGTWEQTGLEADGIALSHDEHSPPDSLCSFDGNRFCVRAADGSVLLEGAFTLDATTDPKSITWVDSMGEDQGKHLPAIYELEGNAFVFVAADEGAPRPTAFRTETGQTLRRFARKA